MARESLLKDAICVAVAHSLEGAGVGPELLPELLPELEDPLLELPPELDVATGLPPPPQAESIKAEIPIMTDKTMLRAKDKSV